MRRLTSFALGICILALPTSTAAQWRAMGLGARVVNRLQVHGADLYACTNVGLYRIPLASPDTLWTFVAFPGQGVYDLAVLGPDTLLLAKDLTAASSDTISIFRSTNEGSSWEPYQNGFGAGSGQEARRILALTGVPGTLLAMGNRVEKSHDGGRSWRVVTEGFTVNALEQSPANPQLVWIGGENLIFSPSIQKSNDAGETWTTLIIPWFGDNAVDGIAGHPSDPSVVYLGMEGRVGMSNDGGATWWNMTSPNPSIYTFGMAIRPFPPLTIYAAGASVVPDPRGVVYFRSYDGGLSWSAFSLPAYAGYGVRHLLARFNGATETIYLATWNGVFRHTSTPVGVAVAEEAPRVGLRAAPNPFGGSTEIEFALEDRQRITLSVIDVRGRTVGTLLDGVLGPGTFRMPWKPGGVAAGIYFLRLETGDRVWSRKLLRLR